MHEYDYKNDILNALLDNGIINSDLYEKCRGYKSPSQRAKEFDASKFIEEDYDEDSEIYDTQQDSSVLGDLELRQWELQRKKEYTDEDISILTEYKISSYDEINDYLWGNLVGFGDNQRHLTDDDEIYLEREVNGDDVSLTLKELTDKLSNIIDKSPRLQQDTILYHSGAFNGSLEVGDYGALKGFTSTSFNKNFTDKWSEENNSPYQLKIYAPKGTKGIAIDGVAENIILQNEFTLDKNQKYVVVGKDTNTNPPTVEILLY